jgi:hypothetical protein
MAGTWDSSWGAAWGSSWNRKAVTTQPLVGRTVLRGRGVTTDWRRRY